MKTKEIKAYGKKVRSIGFHSVVSWQKGINFLSFDSLKDAVCQCTAAMLLSQGITGRIIVDIIVFINNLLSTWQPIQCIVIYNACFILYAEFNNSF